MDFDKEINNYKHWKNKEKCDINKKTQKHKILY